MEKNKKKNPPLKIHLVQSLAGFRSETFMVRFPPEDVDQTSSKSVVRRGVEDEVEDKTEQLFSKKKRERTERVRKEADL